MRTTRPEVLRPRTFAPVQTQSWTPLKLVHGPQAGYRFRTGLTAGSSLCHGVFGGWNVELRHLSITPRVAYCRASLDNATLHADSDAFDVELALAHAFDIPYVTIEFGVAVGGALVYQSFVTAGSAPPRTTGALQVSATAALSTDLPRGFYLFGLVAAETYFLNQTARDGSSRFGPMFTVASSFGVGRRW